MKQTNFDGRNKTVFGLLNWTPAALLLVALGVAACGDLPSTATSNPGSQNSTADGQNEAAAGIDSVKVKELEKGFRIESDEFSESNRKWYKPKLVPKFTNKNGIYCYFQTENGKPSNLRFRVQYYSDDWLFFDKVQFSIDGKAFDYIPSKTETDAGNGGYIWEWFDESLTDADKELVYALSNAQNAKMKLIGKYSDVKVITKEQVKGIKQTLDLYNAMGGKY